MNESTETYKNKNIEILLDENLSNNENSVEDYDSYNIEESDQLEKFGNYILTFGNIGSGKSTLQQWLVTWLSTVGDAEASFQAVNDSYVSVSDCYEMIERTSKGTFPESTAVGNAREYKVSVTPNKEKLPPLSFSFFEISGEELRAVLPKKSTRYTSSLPTYMHGFLANPRIKFSILIVTDAEKYSSEKLRKDGIDHDSEEDAMICSFLDYLKSNFGSKFHRTPLLICLSKWDKVIGLHSSADDYLKRALPQTYSRVSLMRKRKTLVNVVAHSVGTVKISQNGKQFVSKTKYESTEKIARWIYSSFTNKKLKDTNSSGFFERIVRWFS